MVSRQMSANSCLKISASMFYASRLLPNPYNVSAAAAGYGVGWTLLESLGISGAWFIPLCLMTVSLMVIVILRLCLRPIQWMCLVHSINVFVAHSDIFKHRTSKDTYFLGYGPGSAIVIGLFCKAFDRLNRGSPNMLIVGMENNGDEVVIAGGSRFTFPKGKMQQKIIVVSNISSGRGVDAFRRATDQRIPVVSVVVSSGWRERLGSIIPLYIGDREAVLPWDTVRRG